MTEEDGRLPVSVELDLVGMIDPDEPPCVQELLGHKDVRTTRIYVHVMNKPGLAVKSPADSLG